MGRLLLGAALILAAGMAQAADPAEGIWKTQPDDNGNYGHVQIYPCEVRLCGVIVAAFNPDGSVRESKTVGKRMIWDMQAAGQGAYSGGKIWAPDRDKTYSSRMALSGARLDVSGCVFGICRSQAWTRVR